MEKVKQIALGIIKHPLFRKIALGAAASAAAYYGGPAAGEYVVKFLEVLLGSTPIP